MSDLKTDSMRPRHWKALQFLTRCKFDLVERHTANDFTFGELFDLNIAAFSEGVEDIIETATKELKIEKKLTCYRIFWLIILSTFLLKLTSALLIETVFKRHEHK